MDFFIRLVELSFVCLFFIFFFLSGLILLPIVIIQYMFHCKWHFESECVSYIAGEDFTLDIMLTL